jgi:hypothetical protein
LLLTIFTSKRSDCAFEIVYTLAQRCRYSGDRLVIGTDVLVTSERSRDRLVTSKYVLVTGERSSRLVTGIGTSERPGDRLISGTDVLVTTERSGD